MWRRAFSAAFSGCRKEPARKSRPSGLCGCAGSDLSDEVCQRARDRTQPQLTFLFAAGQAHLADASAASERVVCARACADAGARPRQACYGAALSDSELTWHAQARAGPPAHAAGAGERAHANPNPLNGEARTSAGLHASAGRWDLTSRWNWQSLPTVIQNLPGTGRALVVPARRPAKSVGARPWIQHFANWSAGPGPAQFGYDWACTSLGQSRHYSYQFPNSISGFGQWSAQLFYRDFGPPPNGAQPWGGIFYNGTVRPALALITVI